MKFKVFSILLFFSLILSCGTRDKNSEFGERQFISGLPDTYEAGSRVLASQVLAAGASQQNYTESADFIQSMERISEIERSGSYFQGLALFESSLREQAGDYPGAVIAAYKELAWIYGHGGTDKTDVIEGMRRISAGNSAAGVLVNNPVQAVLAFVNESWDQAAELLNNLVPQYDEPDSFFQWMLLVCSLENGEADYKIRNAYGAIRARYNEFPEYWYRGAKTFNTELAAVYAEHCINLNVDGPFAMECRNILARFHGLEESGESIRTMMEIESYVNRSVSESNPEILAGLFPLLNLPDNQYTHYALGALQSLSTVPVFRNYFLDQAVRHTGHLAERLAYIARG